MQVSILMVRVLLGVLEHAGASRDRFLTLARIDPRAVDDGSARLSLLDYDRALAAALEVSGDPAFGLHMGQLARSQMFDVVGSLSQHADTLRESIESMVRYSGILAQGHGPELHETSDAATIRLPLLRGDHPSVRLTAEFAMTALASSLQLFVGPEARPTRVCFAYPEPAYAAEYERIFGGAARFGREHTEMILPREWLDKAQPYRSPEIYALLKAQAERSLARLERNTSLGKRIEAILVKLGPRAPAMDDVARELGISARSLRRRMQSEKLNYNELLERSRMNAAKRLLERPQATVQETAYQMGFASPAAFHRAFKRWTGMTPKQYQESF